MTSSEMNGVCRNPWDPERTPGGSSGGAASALAAGLCAVSHGTDGAGSIRVPASFCGLVGVKPTRGLIGFGPEEGDPYLGTSTDGVLCRSVRDAAALLDVLTAGAWGPRRRMSYLDELGAESPRLRIAVTADFLVGEIDADVRATTVDAARALEERGHVVEEAAPAWEVALLASGPLSVPGPAGLVTAEQVRLLEPRNRPMVEGLAAMTILQHHAWVKELRRASAEFLRFWDRYDVLLSPTCGMLPPSVDWAPWDQTPEEHMATFSTMANFAHPFNVSGQPALTVPVGWSAGGLPIGVQLAGRPHDEGVLLRLARELEEARPWAGRRPPGLE
jgi:amidase